MNRANNILMLISLCALLVRVPARAQDDWRHRAYVKADAGAVLTSSTGVGEIFGPVAPGTRIDFEAGPRFAVDVGYNVTDWFAGELEVGIMANSIDKIGGAQRVEATFLNVPVLLNARFQLPTGTPFTPYVGIGGGGASSVLDVNHLDYGNTHVWGTGSDAVFAWQVFGGFRVAFNHHMGLGLEYRYFRSEAPSFEAEQGTFWNAASDRLKIGEIESHVISLRFDMTF
jgi:opacity protein-like surface antigen